MTSAVSRQAPGPKLWRRLATQLRIDAVRCTTEAGSGHPTSSMSCADLVAVLLASHLRYDLREPGLRTNDSFILSKGHAAPLLYAALKAFGAISDAELMTLRKRGSRLEGHPIPGLPLIEAATGSLGQGLAIGVGDALAGRYLDELPYRTWVLLGDSEMAEGSNWEAFHLAGHHRLNNLVAIVDVNRLGQRGETALGWDTGAYAARARSFGWEAIEIDGHDVDAIDRAYSQAEHADRPVCIVARTVKGHGAALTEDEAGWHGMALSPEQAGPVLDDLRRGWEGPISLELSTPAAAPPVERRVSAPITLPRYELGSRVATREVYGEALKAIGAAGGDVVVLDAEVSNSTYAITFQRAWPERFFEMFIAEQLMIGVAIGLAHRGRRVFSSTFAAFLTRAFDQIRMAAISRATLKLCGSHAGVSIGEDGPSQMALEDVAMMRTVFGSTVLHPADGNCAAALVALMRDLPGISYLRTIREKTSVLYAPDETFAIGGSRTLRSSANDVATIIGAGVTVHEALRAADALAADGIPVRVIDCYSIKPIDAQALRQAAEQTAHLVVVEDHSPAGGLGEAVLSALADNGVPIGKLTRLAVCEIPGSAGPDEQRAFARIDAARISEAVRDQAQGVSTASSVWKMAAGGPESDPRPDR